MNWVLVIVIYYGYGGTSSQQIGPYSSQADCEKAFIITEQQDSREVLRTHFCIPRPYINQNGNAYEAMPKEVD